MAKRNKKSSFTSRGRGPRRLGLVAAGLVLASAPALAFAADPDAPIATAKAHEVGEVVVNGIPYHETVLPTRLSSSSVYGINLSVMDTPRNTTLISTAQLETLNIQDPRAFSYLTSSSYSDASFGTPNIPRIRGQYADAFMNGMRDSFSQNGYGVPINYDAFQNISITKGPASVIDGPGPNVGGQVDFLTKRPSLTHQSETADITLDTIGNHRWMLDVGGPIIPGDLGMLLSYSGEDSTNTYFTGHYFHKEALYAAVRWQPTDKYRLDVNAEVNAQKYTEEVGVNRVNQALINNGAYLNGAPTGQLDTAIEFGGPFAVNPPGGPGDPYAAVPFLNIVSLTNNGAHLNPKTTLDETPGVGSQANLFNFQAIQTYDFNADLKLENNTLFMYQDSANYEPYYYADSSRGSWSFENRLDLGGRISGQLRRVRLQEPVRGRRDLPVRPHQLHQRLQRRDGVGLRPDRQPEPVGLPPRQPGPVRRRFLYLQGAVRDQAVRHARPRRGQLRQHRHLRPVRRWRLLPGPDGVLAGSSACCSAARLDALQNHTYDPLGGAVCDALLHQPAQRRSPAAEPHHRRLRPRRGQRQPGLAARSPGSAAI